MTDISKQIAASGIELWSETESEGCGAPAELNEAADEADYLKVT